MRGFSINIAGIIIFFNLKGLRLSNSQGIKKEFQNFIYKGSKKPDITFCFKKSCSIKIKARLLFKVDGREVHKTKGNILYVYHDTDYKSIKRIFEISDNLHRVNVYFSENDLVTLFAEIKANFLRPFLPEYLATKRIGILIHAAFLKDNSKTYLFMGRSGAGKTTMAKIWARRFRQAPNSKQMILNDDRAILKTVNGRAVFFNAPWVGDAWQYCQPGPVGNIVINTIFFIYHSKENTAKRISVTEAAAKIFKHTFPVFWHRQGLSYALETCKEIAQRVACYDLGFVKDERAVDFIRNLNNERRAYAKSR